MDVSYTLGRTIGRFINRLGRLNFFAKFVLFYALISNVTLYKEDFRDLATWLTVCFSFMIAAFFYYGMFLMFKGSLRWMGRQLRNE